MDASTMGFEIYGAVSNAAMPMEASASLNPQCSLHLGFFPGNRPPVSDPPKTQSVPDTDADVVSYSKIVLYIFGQYDELSDQGYTSLPKSYESESGQMVSEK